MVYIIHIVIKNKIVVFAILHNNLLKILQMITITKKAKNYNNNSFIIYI